MFDNLLYQNVAELLSNDIKTSSLPQSILLSGPASSGKLTCALEIARVLSCQVKGESRGSWTCTCPSCLKHKALVSSDLLLAGPRDCTLEIEAATDTFLQAVYKNASYINATRYLHVRSVRKLTSRFSQVLWEEDDKISKIAAIISDIDEMLEELDPLHPLLEQDKLEKLCDSLLAQCHKLENGFMYDSLPVSQIRKASNWARYTLPEGKKVLILENADRMQESVRNALLKILEEPPTDTVFILTTTRRGAVMPTILSRARSYNFVSRTEEQQKEVIKRVFHTNLLDSPNASEKDIIQNHLLSYLPVKNDVISQSALYFLGSVYNKEVPNIEKIIKDMSDFEPRVLLKLFLNELINTHEKKLRSINNALEQAAIQEQGYRLLIAVKDTLEYITIYNQSPLAALEGLVYTLLEGVSK
jgi:DNA polymerase-3 subunit gamma/tau